MKTMTRHGVARHGTEGLAGGVRQGGSRSVPSRRGRQGWAGSGQVWQGLVRHVWAGVAARVPSGLGTAGQGTARRARLGSGTAGLGPAAFAWARHGRRVTAGLGPTWLGQAGAA